MTTNRAFHKPFDTLITQMEAKFLRRVPWHGTGRTRAHVDYSDTAHDHRVYTREWWHHNLDDMALCAICIATARACTHHRMESFHRNPNMHLSSQPAFSSNQASCGRQGRKNRYIP